jgi:hypothetical protein
MYALNKLYVANDNAYNIGIVAGDAYGLIDGNPYQNAYTFTQYGDILTHFNQAEEATSYAYDVDVKYYTTYDANLVLMGGNFALSTQDVSGNSILLNTPIYLTDGTLNPKFSLNVDDDNNPFDNVSVSTSVYASCVINKVTNSRTLQVSFFINF